MWAHLTGPDVEPLPAALGTRFRHLPYRANAFAAQWQLKLRSPQKKGGNAENAA